MTSRRSLSCVLILVAALVGLALGIPRARQPSPGGVARITAADLFAGELKRLEPHLGWDSGCVRIDYDGPAVAVRRHLEVWEKGELTNQPTTFETELRASSEVSITVKDSRDEDGKYLVTTALFAENNVFRNATGREVDAPDALTEEVNIQDDSGVLRFSVRGTSTREPVPVGLGSQTAQLSLGDEPLAVWALLLGHEKTRKTATGVPVSTVTGSLEENIARANWALVLKLSLHEWESD